MKIVFIGVISFCVTSFYYIFINFLPLAWLYIPLVMVILVYLNFEFKYALVAALTTGFVTDVHYLYVGPFMAVFVFTIIALRMVDSVTAERRTFASAFMASLFACTFSIIFAQVIMLMSMRFSASFSTSHIARQAQIIVVLSLITGLTNQVVQLLRKGYRA